jgi:hypothetical protein
MGVDSFLFPQCFSVALGFVIFLVFVFYLLTAHVPDLNKELGLSKPTGYEPVGCYVFRIYRRGVRL